MTSQGTAHGSQGTAHGRFLRAIRQGNLFSAELAARDLRGLSLHDALDLVVLIAKVRPDRLEAAAIRWHGRLEIEAESLPLAESRSALAALERLPHNPKLGESRRRRLHRASPTSLPQIANAGMRVDSKVLVTELMPADSEYVHQC